MSLFQDIQKTFKSYNYECKALDSSSGKLSHDYWMYLLNVYLKLPKRVVVVDVGLDNCDNLCIPGNLTSICAIQGGRTCVVYLSDCEESPFFNSDGGWLMIHPRGYDNIFAGFVTFCEVDDDSHCEACATMSTKFASCHACKIRYCSKCFESLFHLKCPYCGYTIHKHTSKPYPIKDD